MCIQLLTTSDAIRSIAVGNGGAGPYLTGDFLDTNDSTKSASFTLCAWWYQSAAMADGEYTIWEFDDNTNSTHALTVTVSGTSAVFNWRIGGTLVASTASSASGNAQGVWHVFASFRKDGTFASSDTQLIASRRGGSAVVSSVATGITSIAVAGSRRMSIGKSIFASTGSAPGVMIGTMRTDVVRDGTAGSTNYTAITAVDYPIEAIMQDTTKLQLAVNHGGQAKPWGGADCRVGAPVVSTSIVVCDRDAAAYPDRYGTGPAFTVVGAPVHVNPLTLVAYAPKLIDRTAVNTTGALDLPANTFATTPQGKLGDKASALALAIRSGFTSRIRVATSANSRGVYTVPCEARLSDGTFTGISCPMNYNECGIVSAFGPDAIVGIQNFPPPSGYMTVLTASSESSQTAEPAYGFDCGTNYPLVADNSEVASTMATATYRISNTSLSTFWTGGRSGTAVYTTTYYLGGCSGRGVKAGYSYRLLCRPHGAFPVSEPLQIKITFLNFPSASAVGRIQKRAATSQNGTDTLGASAGTGLPTMGSTHTPMAITAVAGAWSYDSNDNPISRATFQVDDSLPGLTGYGVGDIIELVTAGGAWKTANEPDCSVILSIQGRGTAACIITIDRPFKSTPTTSDYIKCLDGRQAIRTYTVSFTADEVAAGTWRGVDIKASNDGKSGLVIACIDPLNTSRNGIVATRIGWNGVGYTYQLSRSHVVPHWSDNATHMRRMIESIGIDVLMLGIADQGTAGIYWWRRVIEWANAFRATKGAPDVVIACGGPECKNEVANDYSASNVAADAHVYGEYAGTILGAPVVGWGYDQVRGVHHLARYLTSDEVAESATHPSCAREWEIWRDQLVQLDTVSRVSGSLHIGL